jgi:hypothetical protein
VEAVLLGPDGPGAPAVLDALATCVAQVRRVGPRPGAPATAGTAALREALASCRAAGVLAATRLTRLDPRVALALLALVPAVGGPDAVAVEGPAGPDPRLAFYAVRLLPEVERRLARPGGGAEPGAPDAALAELLVDARALLIPAPELAPLGWG